MSHIDPGPLATYESLADPNLTGYFNNSRMRRHLRKMGLITARGNIVSEKAFRLNNSRKEHQRHIRDVLAQAIIHKALDMERHRQMHIKKQLEEIGKVERVRRVRAERSLRGDEDVLPLLSPRPKTSQGIRHHGKDSRKREKIPILQTVTDSEENEQHPQSVGYPAIPADTPYNTRTDRMTTPYPNVEVDNQHLHELDRDALRSFTLNLSNFDLGSGVSPYSVPPLEQKNVNKKPKRRRPATAIGTMGRRSMEMQTPRTNARSLRLHRKEPPMMHRTQIHTLARVTFKYLGKMVHLDHEEEDPRDEVVVLQQHCGGENLCVFKKLVMKGDNFVIISRRHRNFPFSLTFYLNGVQVERLSTCCEYKHKKGHKLGARSSHFGIMKAEGSQPCFKCLIAQGKLKTKPDPTPPPTGGPSKPTGYKRRRVKKLKGADGEKQAEEYTDDFSKSSDKSEEEIQHDAGKEESVASSEISSDSSDTSTISDVSESEDEDGGGHLSSDTESKVSSISKDRHSHDSDSSTSSTESIDSQKKVSSSEEDRKPKVEPVREKKSPPEATREETPPPATKNENTPPPKVVRKKTPTPPKIITPQNSKSSKESTPAGSKVASSSSDSDTSASVKEEMSRIQKKQDESEKEVKPSILKELTEPEQTPDRPSRPEPETESSSSSSESESSDSESVKSTSSVSTTTDDQQEKMRVHKGSILPLLEGKTVSDLNFIKLNEDQIEEFAQFFSKSPLSLRVEKIILKGCRLGDKNGRKILKSLMRNKSIRTLNLGSNNLTGICAGTIVDICQKNPIDHLDLENNPLKDEGCEEIAAGFTKSQASVVTAQVQKRAARNLIASVLKDTRKELSDEFENGMSSSSSVSSLASTAIAETVFLQSLNIAHTGAGDKTMKNLKEYLTLNPKLSHLDISGNILSTGALESILTPLAEKTNSNLKSLIMDRASINDKDAKMIAEKLSENSLLKELSLKGNEITDDGAKMLLEYRKNNKSLQSVYLTPGNKLSKEGRKLLKEDARD